MTRTTEHYVFHYDENGAAGKEIAKIAELQENCYCFICACLRISAGIVIHYHLCATAEEVGKQYALTHHCDDDEPCSGFALPDSKSDDRQNHIYAVYNEEIQCVGFHEDVHILSYTINRPESQFVREGLAMYFDRCWWGVENHAWAQLYLSQDRVPSIGLLLDDEAWDRFGCEVTYPIAGAFTDYLITRYGMDRYLDFYRECHRDAKKTFLQSFGFSIEAAEKEFFRYLSLFRLKEEIRNLMCDMLSE